MLHQHNTDDPAVRAWHIAEREGLLNWRQTRANLDYDPQVADQEQEQNYQQALEELAGQLQ